jgi:hypothetical protein
MKPACNGAGKRGNSRARFGFSIALIGESAGKSFTIQNP